jgi:hypothetical protein
MLSLAKRGEETIRVKLLQSFDVWWFLLLFSFTAYAQRYAMHFLHDSPGPLLHCLLKGGWAVI